MAKCKNCILFFYLLLNEYALKNIFFNEMHRENVKLVKDEILIPYMKILGNLQL